MCLDHCPLSLEVIDKIIYVYHAWRLFSFLLLPQPQSSQAPKHQCERRIEKAYVFSNYVRRGECVQLYRALPARLACHERRQPMASAVEEGDVVGMRGYPARIEGNEGINSGCGLV